VDVNKVDVLCDPALHTAARHGYLEIVQYLIEHGADVNLLSSSNYTPLYCAAESGELEVIKYLVQHGADVNQGLEVAIRCGHEQVVDYFLKYSD
jgi:ankyrin repeat protein